jgi:nitroreductase
MNSAIETMKKRSSIRTYEDKQIQKETYEKINNYINDGNNLSGPFGNTFCLKLIYNQNKAIEKKEKLGTYGIIKNPQAFIAGITENKDDAIVDYGYVFENLVLFLTDLGLGTCWLGGTYDKDTINKVMKIERGKLIPAIISIGYSTVKRRAFETAMRVFVGAENRKPWRDLFCSKDFNTPLDENTGSLLKAPLDMVCIAPSASNKQPWRLVITDEGCHFYLAHTSGYIGNKMGFDMQRQDIGIAMCHFELACRELGICGHWVKEDPKLSENDEPVYIISWKYNVR